jgi:STE24 endopeptidase
MPIFVIFLFAVLCAPAPWPAPPFGLGPAGSATLAAIAVSIPLLAAFALRFWAIRRVRRDPARHLAVELAYARVRRLLFFVNFGAAVLAVAGLGWGHTVRSTVLVEHNAARVLAPFAELLVPLPYFLILFGCWLIHFDAERTLHRATAFGPTDRPFWSRAGHFFQNLRHLALLVGLPVGLFVTQQTVTRFAPESTRADWYKALSLAVAPVVLILFPLLIKPLLGLKKLPPGPHRERFEALAKRLNFRYRDFLLWPTHGSVLNAMISGVIPRTRYVIFTDRILDEMPADELDGVLGHEIGHAKHGHLWNYLAFLTLSITVLAAAFLFLGDRLDDAGVTIPAEYHGWLVLPPVFVAFAYLFVVFGFLSRRCERQADVYGCKAVSCGNPACTGHDADTVYPPGDKNLCPTGIRTFARGLDRVGGTDPSAKRSLLRAVFAWVRAWQHFTMPRRVAFLLTLIDDPSREPRFQRRVRLLRWGLLLGLAALLVVLGETVGWQALLQVL